MRKLINQRTSFLRASAKFRVGVKEESARLTFDLDRLLAGGGQRGGRSSVAVTATISARIAPVPWRSEAESTSPWKWATDSVGAVPFLHAHIGKVYLSALLPSHLPEPLKGRARTLMACHLTAVDRSSAL